MCCCVAECTHNLVACCFNRCAAGLFAEHAVMVGAAALLIMLICVVALPIARTTWSPAASILMQLASCRACSRCWCCCFAIYLECVVALLMAHTTWSPAASTVVQLASCRACSHRWCCCSAIYPILCCCVADCTHNLVAYCFNRRAVGFLQGMQSLLVLLLCYLS